MPRSQATARASRALFGTGVTVDGPGQVSPGNGSPSAAVAGLVAAFNDKKPAEACNYVEPNEQAECKQGMAAEPASAAETVKNGRHLLQQEVIRDPLVRGEQRGGQRQLP